jgi:diacylglycerol kinase (ATP)
MQPERSHEPARSWWRRRGRSFVDAGRGLCWLVLSQPNARIHAVATLAVAAAGWLFEIARIEWCAVLLAIAIVWTAEGLNSAIEALADHVAPERHPAVGRAKDLAAGAVLAAAIIAAGVGAIVFVPKLWEWLAR